MFKIVQVLTERRKTILLIKQNELFFFLVETKKEAIKANKAQFGTDLILKQKDQFVSLIKFFLKKKKMVFEAQKEDTVADTRV